MDLIVISGIILGVTQLAKTTFGISSRYVPITSFLISCLIFAGALMLNDFPLTWDFVASALVVSLSAIGMYSGVKSTIAK